jgi:uncharacterized protein (PEP-CTERM system associated)
MSNKPRAFLANFVAFGFLATQLLVPAIAETDFGVDIDLGIMRSDNIFLATDGDEQSETIYTISPEFYLTSDDDRFQADLRYQPQALLYSEFDEADEVFHNLDASLTTTLVRERLFLTVNAANFQSISDPEERIPSGNLSLSGNRTESRVLQAMPYWLIGNKKSARLTFWFRAAIPISLMRTRGFSLAIL